MKRNTLRNNEPWLQVGLIAALALGLVICRQMAAQGPEAPAPKPKPVNYLPPTKDNYLKLAEETEATLRRDVLDVWFPRSIDKENGGFYPDFTRDWQPARSGGSSRSFRDA